MSRRWFIPGRDAILATLAALLTVGSLTASAPEAFAQNPKWVQLAPPPLGGYAYAYDSHRNRMLFVGRTITIWALELTDPPQWRDLEVTNNPTVSQGALVYDSLRDRLIAYQYRWGLGMPHPHEVWTLDLASQPLQWTKMSDSGTAPNSECCMGMVYDPVRDRVLGFAGGDGFGSNEATVYSLSLSNNTWSYVSTSGVAPGGRRSPTVVYDPLLDRVLEYGGFLFGFTTFFDETWSLSLSGTPTWGFLTPTQFVAFARAYHVAVVDQVGRRMIVSGGVGPGAYDDTWALDLDAPAGDAVWTQIAPAPATRPAARQQAAACYDPSHQRMLLYGGLLASGEGADLWSLDLAGTPAWTPPAGGVDPPPVTVDPVMFIDPASQEIHANVGAGAGTNTWVRPLTEDANWGQVQTTGPAPRRGRVAVTDAVGGRGIVFGGEQGSPPVPVDETWSYDLSTHAWSLLSPALKPSPRADALGILDPTRRKLILYGGLGRTPTGRPLALADTWSYDVVTGEWTLLSVGSMGGRWDMVGFYDARRDRIVAFGGRDTTNRHTDTFVLPLSPAGPWTPLTTTGTPPSTLVSNSVGAAYDETADRLLVLAGGFAYFDSLRAWSLSFSGTPAWTALSISGRTPPFVQDYPISLDAPRRRAIVYGGARSDGYSGEPTNETWALYFDQSTTAVLVALVQSDVSEDRVRLEWFVDGASGASFAAHRRAEGEDWAPMTTLLPDGTGRIVLEDRDVVPGGRYDYRLGVVEGGSEHYYGQISVAIPVRSTFRLEGARPNPTSGPLAVSFALASDAPATLELLDLAGRRVFAREVGSFGRGEHVLRMAEAGSLRTGLYFARLVEGRSMQTVKVVVAR